MVSMYDVPFRGTQDLLDRISVAWVNVVGHMKGLALDGETGMRSKEADGWALYNQVALTYNEPHQKAWLVERQNAPIRSALERANT